MQFYSSKVFKTLITVATLSFSFISPVFAQNVNDGIYFKSVNSSKTGYYPEGYSTHIFNKYLDSDTLCREFLTVIPGEVGKTYLDFRRKINLMSAADLAAKQDELKKEGDKFVCNNYEKDGISPYKDGISPYGDERDFIGITKIASAKTYNPETGTYTVAINEDYNQFSALSLERSVPYKSDIDFPVALGDIIQVKVYVHDNAQTKLNSLIKNTKVDVSLSNGTVTARVGNEQVFSVDTSSVKTLPADTELVFAAKDDYPKIKIPGRLFKYLSDDGFALISYDSSTNSNNETTIGSKQDRPIPQSQMSISTDRKTFTYNKGDQMGSFPYSYSLVLDLVVKKKITQDSCSLRVQQSGPNASTGEVCVAGTSVYVNGVGNVPCTTQCKYSTGSNCGDSVLAARATNTTSPLGVCVPGENKNGQTCSNSCQWQNPGSNTCSDRVRQYGPNYNNSGEICIAGTISSDGTTKCNASCTAFNQPVLCTELFTTNRQEFTRRGYECITPDGGKTDSCTGDQPQVINGVTYGECKIIPDNKTCSACGCVELDINPTYAGNYQDVQYVAKVSNQTTNTLAANVQIKSQQFDGSAGVEKFKYLDNIRNGGNITRAQPTSEGEVRMTDDAALVKMTVSKRSPRRDSDPLYNNGKVPEPSLDRNSVVQFLQNPKDNYILVNNLVPGSRAGTIDNPSDGDEVTITIPAKVRTDQSGVDKYAKNYSALSSTTQFVDYFMYLKTQTNGAVDSVVISKPYFVTYNAGDVVTSLALTGLANASKLSNAFNVATNSSSFNEVSGFLFNTGDDQQVFTSSKDFQGITYTTGFRDDLKKNIDKTTNGGMSTSLFSGTNLTITNENAISNTNFNQRLDGERIFTLPNGDVTISGTDNGNQLVLSNRSTVIIEKGDLIINSDIVYGKESGNIVPAVAFILKEGTVKIDPRVARIDGVYVANKFAGTEGWESVYQTSKIPPIKLLVNGSLLGSIKELIESRPFVNDPNTAGGGASINVNYDGRMIATPPPGLREILGGTFEKLKQ